MAIVASKTGPRAKSGTDLGTPNYLRTTIAAVKGDRTPQLTASVRSKAQSLVEGISSSLVLGSQPRDECLGAGTCVFGRLVRIAHVGELITDAVGDDVGVEGVLLSLGNQSVSGQEGSLGGLAASSAKLEVHRGSAKAKVSSSQARSRSGGRVGAGGCSRIRGSSGIGIRVAAGTATGTAARVGVGAGAGAVGSCRAGRDVGSRRSSICISSRLVAAGVHRREVAESLGLHNSGHGQACRIEGRGQGSGGVGILNVRSSDRGIDQRDNSTKFGSRREGSVVTDRWNIDVERVEVLLSSNHSRSSLDHSRIVTKGGDNLICQGELRNEC